MRAYSIALFFIIFGAVIGMMNDIAIYDRTLPEHNIGLSDADVTEITEGVSNTGINPISYASLAIRLGTILFSGIITALFISPLLMSYNIPIEIIACIQGPIWFVYALGIWQFFSGRSTSGMD